ncbi:helix-turn-helix domain-containing protein [Staphylococcus pseudintermedius]|nr:helix-turn-helix transcriptional regulator [Staphylococcus pseudintermedius]EGQ3040308.1 helix-turn-helix transcriptional regulator [Staphylococcus pseudintermedius]EGQ3333267.1 helix-turn-helix transcriptional regulator [Staphylococcus pseudintermedius]EGQ3528558.1 helix-turn-helix transcriptional regulator [Staphylococcus pseudintermedius]EII2051114.1 helix-turn-helix transcriptional regulator [Staphylococcus pseudintermedius]
MDVGNQIRIYRKERQLSQMALAEKIDVSTQTISNWENERTYPDLYHLIVLSSLFNVSLDQLVKGDVVEMKNIIDHYNMDRYGKLMLVFMLIAVISVGPVLKFSDGWYGLFIPFIFWAFSMYDAIKIERLKKKYDVKTYKEIVYYMEYGAKTYNDTREKKKLLIEETLIVVVFAAVSVVLMLGSLFLFNLF